MMSRSRGLSVRMVAGYSEGIGSEQFLVTALRAFSVQPVSADVEEPDGTYYEYDRNLKATVKV